MGQIRNVVGRHRHQSAARVRFVLWLHPLYASAQAQATTWKAKCSALELLGVVRERLAVELLLQTEAVANVTIVRCWTPVN